MDFSESLEFLGLEPDFTKGKLRSAYLRLLRQYKPEKDPEGFKQLRRAYETLLDHLEAAGEVGETIELGTKIETSKESELVVGESGQGLAAAPSLDPYRLRLDELPLPVGEAHIELAEEALDEHPELEEAWVLAAAVALDAGRAEKSAEVLLRGAARGFARCLDPLATRFPDKMSDEQWRTWLADADARELVAAAEAWLRLDEQEKYRRSLELALERESSTSSPLELARGLLRLALLHQSRDELEESTDLAEKAEARVTYGDDEGLNGELIYYSIFLEELANLPKDFPDVLRHAIGDAVLMGTLEPAKDAVHDFAMRHEHRAPQIARMLEGAPTLSHHLYDLLSGPQSDNYSVGQVGLPFGVVVFFLYLIMRVLSCSPGGSGDIPEISPEKLEELRRQVGIRYLSEEEATFAPCEPPRPLSSAGPCALVRSARQAIDFADCRAGLTSLEKLAADDSNWSMEVAESFAAMESRLEAQWMETCGHELRPSEFWQVSVDLQASFAACGHGEWPGHDTVAWCARARRVAGAVERGECETAKALLATGPSGDDVDAAVAELRGLVEERCG